MNRFIIFINGAAAIAVAAAATVIWSKSLTVAPQATLVTKAPHALIERAHGSHEASDREHGGDRSTRSTSRP